MPTVSVIIVSYNTRAMTLDCLRTLYANLGDIAADVWVVDNGSADGSVDAIRRDFPAVRVMANPSNTGFGAANNLALRESDAEFALLLNSDAFIRPGAVQALVNCLRDHPTAAVAGPRLLNQDCSLQRSCYRFPTPFRSVCEMTLLSAAFPNSALVGDYRAWDHDCERAVDFVSGACMLVRRSALEQVGVFDERFFLYAEETDWCLRFQKAGWKIVFTPDGEVIHLNQGSGQTQSERVFNEFRYAQETFINKHHGLSGLWLYRCAQVFGAAIRVVLLGSLDIVRFQRRKGTRHGAREWGRILVWNLGFRGPRLLKQ